VGDVGFDAKLTIEGLRKAGLPEQLSNAHEVIEERHSAAARESGYEAVDGSSTGT
jgi:hypothetical protein